MYFVKTPRWLMRLYPNCTWQMPADEKIIYLTFDDGPHPVATPFVLEQLKKYNALATFFCIGKNVVENHQVYEAVLNDGHAVGNHTMHHLNGWKTADDIYINDIAEAKKYIDSGLFRPPYGRATRFQLKMLATPKLQLKPVMWTVISGDFDNKVSEQDCLLNVLKNTTEGSIVVFHDSEKAFNNVRYTLPKVLEHFADKGYRFEKIIL
ncbi:MAG TPA: polysaccharide deacetylase family protein [Ferruginibacter sp.]|nr:polysaccharide deacetylase family protein [Ferruginibacter sp.]HMP19512.1 polysaccharide deacetylase family protein [Ferruginibacter sp.]